MDEAAIGKVVGEVTITYSVRELLSRIEERQVRADERMGNLATRTEVEDLAAKVALHEARWNRLLGAAIAVGALAGGATGWLAQIISAR
jgi:hypothetical protein